MLPLDRLGRWSIDRFVPVLPDSVDAERVFVITHGWAPGAKAAVDDTGGNLRLWDESAASTTGLRFDGWIRDLAKEITRIASGSAVLCYSWIDESATQRGNLSAIQSQRRTTANGQRLAVALQHALSAASGARPHLIGYSHGARVVTVAATVLQRPPSHLTLLDSPDGLLPVLGGGLNDLSSLLRVVSHRVHDGSGVRVDNYPSTFGIRYGRQPGLEQVLDVVLDPPEQPEASDSNLVAVIANAISEGHRYAPEWYAETARLDLPVGFGWSALVAREVWPGAGESRQASTEEPYTLTFEAREAVPRNKPPIAHTVRRDRGEPLLLTVDNGSTVHRSVAWRRRGDQIALLPVRWLEGDAGSELRVTLAGRERGSTTRGWSTDPAREIVIPGGDIRRGPMSVVVELASDGPASVEVSPPSAIHHFRLPAYAETSSWLFPLSIASLVGGLGALLAASYIGIRRIRRRGSGIPGER